MERYAKKVVIIFPLFAEQQHSLEYSILFCLAVFCNISGKKIVCRVDHGSSRLQFMAKNIDSDLRLYLFDVNL